MPVLGVPILGVELLLAGVSQGDRDSGRGNVAVGTLVRVRGVHSAPFVI